MTPISAASAMPATRRRRLSRLAPLALALLLAACRVDLYASLNEAEANQMLAVLTAEGIDADKVRAGETGWSVRVDEAQLPAALEILRSEGLPGERFSSLGQVFQKQGLVATPTEERMRYIFALSQELSETLRNIDGVVTARVHVVIRPPIRCRTRSGRRRRRSSSSIVPIPTCACWCRRSRTWSPTASRA